MDTLHAGDADFVSGGTRGGSKGSIQGFRAASPRFPSYPFCGRTRARPAMDSDARRTVYEP